MFCKKCGSHIEENLLCPICGFQNTLEDGLNNYKFEEVIEKDIENNDNDISSVDVHNITPIKNKLWVWLSGIMFAVATIPLYKGYDKMTNYYYSDIYHSLNKNAYVGGDAYNYIINAGYATAFFVLAIGAALLGVGFLILYYLSDKKVN